MRLTDKDTLNLVLVRWLTHHPNAHQRDSESLPICPGPLQHIVIVCGHQTPRPRKIMVEKGKPSRAFKKFVERYVWFDFSVKCIVSQG